MSSADMLCKQIGPRSGVRTDRIFTVKLALNSSLLSSVFCYLLITFANSLSPDQDRQNVSSDLVPNRLTL